MMIYNGSTGSTGPNGPCGESGESGTTGRLVGKAREVSIVEKTSKKRSKSFSVNN